MKDFRHSALEIVSLRDEYDFWSRVSGDSAESPFRKELALEVLQEFEPILVQFEKLESLDIDEMMELMELTQDFLDSLWRVCRHSDDEKGLVAAYSKQGMTYLLHVVGKALFDALCKMISKVDLWMDPFLKVEMKITEGLSLSRKWEEVILELTGLTWTSSREHKWVGDPFKDALMATLSSRLQEILKIREVHARRSKFFSEDEVSSSAGQHMLNCFSSLDACDCSDAGQRAWKIMGEIRKYKELFGSPLVAKSLHDEWEMILALLQNIQAHREPEDSI